MNDDKDRILQACNSFSAEELFHFIRSGDLTLLDLVRAGLDDNKLVGLQELMAIEEDNLWAEVQTKRTPALCRRYLQAYPNGRYAGRCTKLLLQLADKPGDGRPVPDETPATDQPATPSAPPAPPQPEPAISEEDKLWNEVQARRTIQLCGRYLQTYPDGRHAGECAQIIAQLTKKQNEQRKHTAATPPADNNRPAASPSPVKQRKHNQRPPRELLWESTILALLLAVLVWQLATGGSESKFSDQEIDSLPIETVDSFSAEDTASVPAINDTIIMLYDEVKQNLLYFHDEQTWDDNMFDATRRNLETLYYQKDEDPSAREYLSQIEKDVVMPYYGKACSIDLRFIIEKEVNAKNFDNFIDGLERQIKKWDKERQEKEAEAAFHLNQPRSDPKQKKEKAKETKPSKPKARTTTPTSGSKANEGEATPEAAAGKRRFGDA